MGIHARTMDRLSLIARLLARYLLVWVADAVSIGFTALIMPGIYFIKESQFWYLNPFVVALWLALLNVLVRPLLITLLLPINVVTLGLASLILNSSLFYLIDNLVTSFVITSFPAALVGLLVLSTVNTLLANFLIREEEYSLFFGMMHGLGRLTRKRGDTTERGLVVIQLDGLSLTALTTAMKRGKMPFTGSLLSRRDYRLQRWFSGLPSQTSSVQAALFYGDNFNIPGFRWYDRVRKKQMVSSSAFDMGEIDSRYHGGDGSLLAGGTSVNTLIHGGAAKRLLTLSAILEKDIKKRRGEFEDFAIFFLHPYLYNRALVLMGWDFLVDRVENLLDLARKKSHRVPRNIKFSLMRAVGNVLLRESTTYFIMEEIVRGTPIIYANYIGYDIVAHHAGPLSWDAISMLTGTDRQIKKIARTIRRKAPKPYDIVVLSDHGQSASVPFERLYGRSLSGFVVETLERPLVESKGLDAEHGYLALLLSEMRMAEEALGKARLARSRRTLERIRSDLDYEKEPEHPREGVVVCPTGSLAHIYFSEYGEKLTVETLIKLHPDILESLATHPGIGFVALTSETGETLLVGEKGMRRLRSGEVKGRDPLEPYHPNEITLKALRNLCEYPDSGDIIVFGSVLLDGTVVSFEDQVGTHGGLGGLQTEAFVIHPWRADLENLPVESPIDIHRLLRRLISPEGGDDERVELQVPKVL